jgi:hypothetical protein
MMHRSIAGCVCSCNAREGIDAQPNGLPISRSERKKFRENLNDLVREAVGCMGGLGSPAGRDYPIGPRSVATFCNISSSTSSGKCTANAA